MKFHCSFIRFQKKELSPPWTGTEEDYGGVVTQSQHVAVSDHAEMMCTNKDTVNI